MSRSSTISHKLPVFPYSPATAAPRHLTSPLSSSHFVTTIVSPLSSHRSSLEPLCSEEHTDPHQTLSDNADPSSPQAPPSLLQNSPHAPSRSESSKHPIKPSRLPSSKCSPSRSSPPPTFQTAPESFAPPPRRRSAWRRCKRMGNRLVTPLRSMGLCVSSCTGGRRAMAFCEDTSPGSSWYSSGEYPPDFIRAVLENNALFGQRTEND